MRMEQKKEPTNFSISYNEEVKKMTNYIMERTGVTTRSQAINMSIRQYYLTLKADELKG